MQVVTAVSGASGCPRTGFTESIREFPPQADRRLCREAAAAVAPRPSVSAVAAEYQVSWPMIHRHHAAHADQLLTEPGPPVVLGIDEARRSALVRRLGFCPADQVLSHEVHRRCHRGR